MTSSNQVKEEIYSLNEEEITKLAELAVDAKSRAYCPYSSFRVGAALLLSTGAYHTGANVEVASTPCGICAERCAIAPVIAGRTKNAVKDGRGSESGNGTGKYSDLPVIRGLAVATDINPPASPCGFCRQFIREFCDLDMKIWMYGKDGPAGTGPGKVVVMTIGELLPMSFGPNDMDRGR